MAAPLSAAGGPLPPDARFDIGPAMYPAARVDTTITIPMSDGAVLCADLIRPAHHRSTPVDEALPVVVTFTPYNRIGNRYGAKIARSAQRAGRRVEPSDRRRFRGRDLVHTPAGGVVDIWADNRTLVSRGYASLVVDVRGTGSSTGSWDFFTPRDQQDYVEVLAWIREQPWCNGHLALSGLSYAGIAALIAAGQRPEGLDAVFVGVAGEDPVRELGLTGGVPTPGMVLWMAAINAGKWVPSLRGLVENRVLGRYLRDRVREPISWLRLAGQIAFTEGHPDAFLNDQWAARLSQLENITAATWILGAWHDVYNSSNFRMFDRLGVEAGVKQLLVDDGYHLSLGSGFGEPGNPPAVDELQCAWFDHWLKGIDNGIERYGPITIRRQGDGAWVARPHFPGPTATVHRLHLTAESSGSAAHAAVDASLRTTPCADSGQLPLPTGRRSLASNNTAIMSCGVTTLLGRSFATDDRRAEATAVTFTTEPLPTDVILSGPLNLHLRVQADATEAFWSVTITDVEPSGASVPLTRGALLSSLRAIDDSRSTRIDGELVAPVHPLRADMVLPVVPGEPFDIDIAINPTEALLRAGHRLRLTVASSCFPRHYLTPALKRKIKGQSIILDPAHPSYLTLLATGLPGHPPS
ncbi:CocE/NonD family hydrolase [Nocardia transvalensis]|uniref:CocE/NonD family hydrolase n=1 Tax=Nocardia transvalensis TaxID=37333 RepID=UPI001893C0CA|nr:CocE/NonD family hydrolase [Nocardia transvalensis]MBF6334113.1 CocE/NonD family hydrolase [Nocardia transvalensis]